MHVFALYQTHEYDCSVLLGVFETESEAKAGADRDYRKSLPVEKSHYTVKWSRADSRQPDSHTVFVCSGSAKGHYGYVIERVVVGELLL